MAKAAVYALLAAAFVVLLFLRPASHARRRPLSRRLGDRFRAPAFDPLIEERESDQTVDARGHFGNDDRLNITLRLVVLFPLMDRAPKDGLVSRLEMVSWVRDMAVDRLNRKTRKELASRDRDGDGTVSFREYFPKFTNEDIAKNDMSHGGAGWWKQQFDNADIDRNGLLSFDELKDFSNPEDSENVEIKRWLMREKIKKMDEDKDGKLNFGEFSKNTYNTYKNYIEYENTHPQPSSAQHKFLDLDLNNDKLLEVDELIPILDYLHPGELSYAKYYAAHLMQEADDNKDGSLALEEMFNHEYIFYSTVYTDDFDDDFDDHHDEL